MKQLKILLKVVFFSFQRNSRYLCQTLIRNVDLYIYIYIQINVTDRSQIMTISVKRKKYHFQQYFGYIMVSIYIYVQVYTNEYLCLLLHSVFNIVNSSRYDSTRSGWNTKCEGLILIGSISIQSREFSMALLFNVIFSVIGIVQKYLYYVLPTAVILSIIDFHCYHNY